MDRTAIGLAAVLYLSAVALTALQATGPGAAPAHMVLAVGLLGLGLGVLAGKGLFLSGRQAALTMAAAAVVLVLSLTWPPLLQLGQALLAGPGLEAPAWWGLLLLLLLPAGVPSVLLGASLAVAHNLRRNPWTRTLRRFALGAGLGAAALMVLALQGERNPWWLTVAAAAVLVVGLLPNLGAKKPAPRDEEEGGSVLSLLAPALLGLGLAVALRGFWRGWESLQGIEAWSGSLVLGAFVLLIAMEPGTRLPSRSAEKAKEVTPPAWGLAALGVLALLLWAWPPLLGLLTGLTGGGAAALGWLVMALLATGLAGLAASFTATGALSGPKAGRGGAAAWLLAGAGAGWLLGTYLILPPAGFARTAGAGVLLAVLSLVAVRPAWTGLAVAAVAGLVVLLLPADPAAFYRLDPAAGESLEILEGDAATTLAVRTLADGTQEVLLGGRAAARGGPAGLGNRVMAGHLPVLLREETRRALVVTAGPVEAVRALLNHGVEVDLRVPSPAVAAAPSALVEVREISMGGPALEERLLERWPELKAGLVQDPPPLEGRMPEARPAAGLLLPETLDLLLTLLPAPGHPLTAPWYGRDFYRLASDVLGEDGLLVQLVDLSALVPGPAPASLTRFLQKPAGAFGTVDLWSFDLGAGGEYLLVATNAELPINHGRLSGTDTGPGSARLAYDRLRSGLVGRDDLLLGLVLRIEDGEVADSLGELPPAPALRRGSDEAKEWLLRALYARQRRAWPVSDSMVWRAGHHFLPAQPLATMLSGWEEKGGWLEMVTQVVTLPGVETPGIFRELRPSTTITMQARSLKAETVPMILPDEADITEPLAEVGLEVARTGKTIINGHPAFWLFQQSREAPRDQTLTTAWFCPVQGKRYAVTYRNVEGSPNRPDPLVAWVAESVTCPHGGER